MHYLDRLKQFQRLIAAPHFEDENKTRTANIMNMLLLAFTTLVLLDVISNLILQSTDTVFYVSLDVVLLLALSGLQVGMRRGHLKATALLLCIAIWLTLTVGTYPAGGVTDPYFPAFIISILTGGLLLGGWAAGLFAVLSSLSGLLAMPASSQNSEVLLQIWTGFTLIFAATAFMLYLADRSIKQAFARARNVEQVLRENNARLEQEITERRRIETTLRSTEEFLTHLLENTPAIVSVITIDGRFQLINRIWETMTHKSKEEVLNHKIEDVFSEAFTRQVYQSIQPVIEQQEPHTDEQEIHRSNGEVLYLYNCKFPIFDNNGQLSAVGIVSVDITDTKRAQEVLLKTELQRVEIEKEKQLLQLKESFVSMASHEFRAPLSVILSSKEVLKNYYERLSDDKRKEHFERIDSQIHLMNEMLEDLLTLSKASAGVLEFDPQPMDLSAFCAALVAEIQGTDSQEHDLIFQRDSQWERSFKGDEKLLRYILRNLLTNAIKYSPAGSQIDVTLKVVEDNALLEVTDHGIGIPEEDQALLFQPFHRARNAHEISGTGLGMAIVKNSVEVHQGRISFISREGQGTTFSVRLPLNPEKSTIPESE